MNFSDLSINTAWIRALDPDAEFAVTGGALWIVFCGDAGSVELGVVSHTGREHEADVGVLISNWSRNGFLYSTGSGTHSPPSSASQLPS